MVSLRPIQAVYTDILSQKEEDRQTGEEEEEEQEKDKNVEKEKKNKEEKGEGTTFLGTLRHMEDFKRCHEGLPKLTGHS